MFNIKMFYLTDLYLCFCPGNYKVQRWDIHKQDFLESASGLGMFVTVTSPTADVNMLYECFCRIYKLTSGSSRQPLLKILKIIEAFGGKWIFSPAASLVFGC